MSQFAIVQESYEKHDPELLGPILQKALGLVRYDAMRQAREGRGILAERLDEGAAERLETALKDAGIEARRIPQESVVRIEKPSLARQLAMSEASLDIYIGYTGQTVSVPWPNVLFLSAGEIVEVSVHRVVQHKKKKKRGQIGLMLRVATGDPFAAYKLLRSAKKGKEIEDVHRTEINVHLADIFALMEPGKYMHVRLRSRELYYDRILGDEATKDFYANFQATLARLANLSVKAVISPGFRVLVLGADAPEIDADDACFGEEIEFTEYNRWQLQMLLLGSPES